MMKITTYSGKTYYTYNNILFGMTSLSTQTIDDSYDTLEISDIDTISIMSIVEIVKLLKK